MATMIEKVARAIAKSDGNLSRSWVHYTDEARAAIEAMREPTEAMLAECGRDEESRKWAAVIWRTAIDAALAEG